MNETQEKLEYLKGLAKQYGSHYLKKYFGFSLKDIADFMGVSKSAISDLVKGKTGLTKSRELSFSKAFEQFDIYNKTKDFKESETQKSIKEFWKQQKKT